MAAKQKKKKKVVASVSETKSKYKKKFISKRMSGNKMSKKVAGSDEDIVTLILADHKPLKQLIKIMKSEKAEFSERMKAFEEFAPLFLIHAKAEDEALYTYFKKVEDLREHGFKCQVEHSLAEQALDAVQASEEQDLTSAQIKVLAELVENHIAEEENVIFPDFIKESILEDREDIGRKYLKLKKEFEEEIAENRPKKRESGHPFYHHM